MSASEKLKALKARDQRLTDWAHARYDLWDALPQIVAVVDNYERLLMLAEHLFQMVPEQTWRDSGGDDGQGHYEGEYHAATLRDELAEKRAALTALDEALS